MKFFAVVALLGSASAIQLNQKVAFVDDIVKALAQSDKQEAVENNSTTTVTHSNNATKSTK